MKSHYIIETNYQETQTRKDIKALYGDERQAKGFAMKLYDRLRNRGCNNIRVAVLRAGERPLSANSEHKGG